MDEDDEKFTPPVSWRQRIGNIVAWSLAFALCGGLLWSTMTFQCMCGHSAMNVPLGAAIFGIGTGGGALFGWLVQGAMPHRPGVGVLVAIALMMAGTVAAFMLAGNDLDEAHSKMFKPADSSVTREVVF